ncbi:MAG: class I SAM-dependent methyltransferase, partial [Candidatus Paceibacterales bacterium]
FDVILCNHVLEHVAEPLDSLKRLRTLMNDGGIIYAEVPFEVWGGIPIEKEPVTHINFFTPQSFKAMFEGAQFSVLEIRSTVRAVVGVPMAVIWVVATKKSGGDTSLQPQGQKTWSYLVPSRCYSFKRFLKVYVLPQVIYRWCFIKSKFGH